MMLQVKLNGSGDHCGVIASLRERRRHITALPLIKPGQSDGAAALGLLFLLGLFGTQNRQPFVVLRLRVLLRLPGWGRFPGAGPCQTYTRNPRASFRGLFALLFSATILRPVGLFSSSCFCSFVRIVPYCQVTSVCVDHLGPNLAPKQANI